MDPFRRRMVLYFIVLMFVMAIALLLVQAYHSTPAYNVILVVFYALGLLVFGALIIRDWVRRGIQTIRRPILITQLLLLTFFVVFLGVALVHLG